MTKAEKGSQEQTTAIDALKGHTEIIKETQSQLRFASTYGRTIKGKIKGKDKELNNVCTPLATKAYNQWKRLTTKKRQSPRL